MYILDQFVLYVQSLLKWTANDDSSTLCSWQRYNRSCADLEGDRGNVLNTYPRKIQTLLKSNLHSKVTENRHGKPHPGKQNYSSDPLVEYIFGSAHESYGPGLGVRWSVTFFAGAVNVLVTDSRFLGLPGGKEIRKFLMSCE